jgi:predicted Rossmann fold nucleotide-binding protein DprA/Smf involved in DNA uptake
LKAAEAGFLLLTSRLGDPDRKNLTVAQFRTLTARVRTADISRENRDLTAHDLVQLGYSTEMATRILSLLADTQQLEYYLAKGRRSGCVPVTRAGERYPIAVRKRLGEDSPGCLWAKGDLSLLEKPCISLVGSRDLRPENRIFAQTVGLQAAKQGYTLVSGNARGADKTAQEACLAAGGSVICVVADQLELHRTKDRVLYLSEDAFDEAFSAQRALSRNRVIHCFGAVTLVAQTSDHKGGTWSGTLQNLHRCWSKVCCFRDGSQAADELLQQGAVAVNLEDLEDLNALLSGSTSLFD